MRAVKAFDTDTSGSFQTSPGHWAARASGGLEGERMDMSQTVLLIDDSVPIHKILKAHLSADELCLHSANDGPAGLAAAAKLRPSLILLDLDMPSMDGFEVCRRLKSDAATAGIPVIFLTANSQLADRVKGLELGAVDYVSKPFKPQELRARIRAALRGKDQLDATKMIDGPTGLWSRTYLEQHMARYVSLARRTGSSLACIVAQVRASGGKASNPVDSAGGDMMRDAAQILRAQCRAEDLLCRWDNWKLVILLPGAKQASAALMVERLGAQIAQQLKPTRARSARFTIGFGVSDTLVADGATLLDRADIAAATAHIKGVLCIKTAPEAVDGMQAAA